MTVNYVIMLMLIRWPYMIYLRPSFWSGRITEWCCPSVRPSVHPSRFCP